MNYLEMRNIILNRYHKDINYWYRLLGEMFEGTYKFTKAYEIKCNLDGKLHTIYWKNHSWEIDNLPREYDEKIKNFLEKNNIQVDIEFIGIYPSPWKENPTAKYGCTIKTAKGKMRVIFHDSIYNTAKLTVDFEDYCRSHYHKGENSMLPAEKQKVMKQWRIEKNEAIPNEYDIISHLQLDNPGSMDNFFEDYGFKIKCVKDMTNFMDIYNAISTEYQNVCRCFSKEQIEELRTLQ